MLLLDRKAWFVALKMFAASMTALFIAIEAHLDRPYWSMMTVYIVYLPLVGATRAKGMNRILGTILGGAGNIIMIPNLVQTPIMLILAMSIWLGLFVFLAQTFRGPTGYIFMLAAYTTSFIGFPYVGTPEVIFNIVLSRCEEISLGALTAVVFASLVFPARVRPAITGSVQGWLNSAADWSHKVLLQNPEANTARNVLAGSLSQFEGLIDSIRHDDPRHLGNRRILEGIHDRLLTLMPVLSSIGDSISAFLTDGRELPQPFDDVLKSVAEWIKDPDSGQEYDVLIERIHSLQYDQCSKVDQVIINNLRIRLEELVKLWWDFRELSAMIRSHREQQGARPVIRALVPHFPLKYHFDYQMMLFSAVSAGASLFAYCLVWVGVGWQAGGNGAMITAVLAAFFASKDDPIPNMREFMIATLAAIVADFLLVFWLLPMTTTFVEVAMAMAIFYVPLGLLMARASTYFFALPFIANMAALLQLSDSYTGDQTFYLNSALGMLIGVIFAIVITGVFRSVGSDLTARRLVRQSWSILASAAAGHGRENRHAYTARMFDLLAALAPRLAVASNTRRRASGDMLNEIRIGLNILQLRRARSQLSESEADRVTRLLNEVANFYRAQNDAKRELDPPSSLLDSIEQFAIEASDLAEGSARNELVMGLFGLRRGLYTYRSAPDTDGQLSPAG